MKELDTLHAKQYRQVASTVLDLMREPFPRYSKKLTGSPYHRLAVGEHRVVYQATDDLVSVLAIGKRNDDSIYRTIQRR